MKSSPRKLWLFGAIAIAAIVLLTLFGAPATSGKLNSGSTYGRDPTGYGAWYAYMQSRKAPIQRWQKPFDDLTENPDIATPVTFLKVYSQLTRQGVDRDNPEWLYESEREWVGRGNTLAILGIWTPVTEAPFSTVQQSPVGGVEIDTQRRTKRADEIILGDDFGAIVWQEDVGKGQAIYVNTPYLAANAYQDAPGNYEFLANLITEGDRPIFVDEYLHGYKDREVIEREEAVTLLNYFARTPLFPIFIQFIILFIVLILAKNRRFGQPEKLSAPIVENSRAYIEALAGVLQKAGTRDLILDVVGKEEQLQLQKALGLGQIPLEYETLAAAWAQQTGRPPTELMQQLQARSQTRRLRESDLLIWVKKWASIRRHIPS